MSVPPSPLSPRREGSRGGEFETSVGGEYQTIVDNGAITATLNDSEAACDFASLLPLVVTLQDYAATEKIATLPCKLSIAGAPPGSDAEVGDISYYAPWGNLALNYRDFGYSAGLVKLGRLDGGVDVLQRSGSMRATISRIEP